MPHTPAHAPPHTLPHAPAHTPPRIIIHVGMHKTGTSSIQDTFYHSTNPKIAYVDWERSNHSSLFVLLFQDMRKFDKYHMFRNAGPEFIARLPKLRALWRDRVAKQVREATGKTVIFSAEDCSAPIFEAAAERMHRFFSEISPDICAVGYARDPGSFIQSAFQQNLRGGHLIDLERKGLRPNYRMRLEKFDRIFGRDHVIFKEFHPDTLIGGNAVTDFAATIGVDVPSGDEIRHANAALSLEATALLYVQRKFGRGMVAGFPQAEQANNQFVAKLARIGTGKFALSHAMLAPLLERIEEDVTWIEGRLGHAFTARDNGHSVAISTMDDLIDVALRSYEDLAAFDPTVDGTPATFENLLAALERVRQVSYADHATVLT